MGPHRRADSEHRDREPPQHVADVDLRGISRGEVGQSQHLLAGPERGRSTGDLSGARPAVARRAQPDRGHEARPDPPDDFLLQPLRDQVEAPVVCDVDLEDCDAL